jgi:RNA polymerase sigma-70 factor (ECF subfamily)
MADPEDAYVPRHVADAADQGLLARSAVEEVLSTLTTDQRMVLVLRVVQQFSVEETARIIGKSEGSVKLLQHRALASLRRTLASRAQPGPLEGVPG